MRTSNGIAFKALAICGIAYVLAGCATVPATKYVPVYCLTQQQFDQLKAQEPPKIKSQLNGQADHDLEIVAGSAIRLRAFGDGLITVLGGCVAK